MDSSVSLICGGVILGSIVLFAVGSFFRMYIWEPLPQIVRTIIVSLLKITVSLMIIVIAIGIAQLTWDWLSTNYPVTIPKNQNPAEWFNVITNIGCCFLPILLICGVFIIGALLTIFFQLPATLQTIVAIVVVIAIIGAVIVGVHFIFTEPVLEDGKTLAQGGIELILALLCLSVLGGGSTSYIIIIIIIKK